VLFRLAFLAAVVAVTVLAVHITAYNSGQAATSAAKYDLRRPEHEEPMGTEEVRRIRGVAR
jgi:hypothetical protein